MFDKSIIAPIVSVVLFCIASLVAYVKFKATQNVLNDKFDEKLENMQKSLDKSESAIKESVESKIANDQQTIRRLESEMYNLKGSVHTLEVEKGRVDIKLEHMEQKLGKIDGNVSQILNYLMSNGANTTQLNRRKTDRENSEVSILGDH